MNVNDRPQYKANAPSSAGNQASWTVMVYFAADNDLEDEAVANIKMMKKVGSTDQVKIVAQLDSRKVGSTLRLLVRNEGTMLEEDIVDELPEVNTGDPDELVDFVKWAMLMCPARRYMLVLWGHGRGWETLDNSDRAAAPTVDRVIPGKPLPGVCDHLSFGLTRNRRLRPFGKKDKTRLMVATTQLNQILDQQEFGLLQDEVTGRGSGLSQDVLRMEELKSALERALDGRKLDILGMDACLMGMAEVAYQIKGHARYLVASEHGIPDESWPYDLILARLKENSEMTPEDLSVTVVREYLIRFREQEREVTKSVCDLDRSKALADAISGLAYALIKNLSPAVRNSVLSARVKAQSFYITDFVDLYDFCAYLKKYCPDRTIAEKCEVVMNTIRSETGHDQNNFVVEFGYFGHSLRGSNGVSIYFPSADLSSKYAGIDFAKDTKWGEFLVALTQPIDDFVKQQKAQREKKEDSNGAAGDSRNTLVPALSGGVKTPQGTPQKTPQGTPMKIPTLPSARIPGHLVSEVATNHPVKQPEYKSDDASVNLSYTEISLTVQVVDEKDRDS